VPNGNKQAKARMLGAEVMSNLISEQLQRMRSNGQAFKPGSQEKFLEKTPNI
jgi:hypothetical protein